jgi:hypothetical protein
MALALLLFCAAAAAVPAPNEPYRVLLLHSFRNSLPVNTDWYNGLVRGFTSAPNVLVEIDTETLDLSRFRDEKYLSDVRDIYRRKYSDPKPHLIIPTYTPALQFLLDYGEELFPGVPIVFLGADSHFIATQKLPPHITGITDGKSGQIYFPELTQSSKNGFRFLGYDVQQGKGRAMRLSIASLPMPKRAKADAEFGRKLTLRQTQAVAQLCNVNFFRAVGLSGDRLALVEVNGLTQTFRDAVICFCHEISPVRYESAHLPIWPTRFARTGNNQKIGTDLFFMSSRSQFSLKINPSPFGPKPPAHTTAVHGQGGSEVLRVGDGMNGAQTWPDTGFGGFQVVVGLEIEPVLR